MAPPSAIEVSAVSDTSGVTIPNPLTASVESNEIHGRRIKVNKGQWGVAAPSNTANFRLKSHDHKPKARRWDHIISHEAQIRKGNSLKDAAKYLSKPGIISLGGGLPSSEYFPFEELSIKVPAVGHFSETETRESGVVLTAGKHDLAQEKSTFDIATAFNYGQGSGSAQLLRWVTEHTEMVHDPPYQDWRCTMTIGSTSALDMALRMLSRPGDVMLSEEYTFSAAVECARPLGIRVCGISVDSEGLLPDDMDKILSNWDVNTRGSRKPHLLYTVPTGQNPTGATQGTDRRRALYKVCQKHDIYIIEDEPYYFLQMQPYTGPNAPDVPPPASHSAFLKSLVPSLLSMDIDGRVMRMDSFSKVIAPGSRIGWITASQEIVEKYHKHADVSTQNPSGMSQLILFKLLDEHWGHAGYLDWLIHIRLEYTKRRDVILQACAKYLPRDVMSWKSPMAGMFHWMQIDFRKHPAYPEKSIEMIEESIFLRVIDHGALVMRGSWFYADADEEHHTLFFRATYAAAPAEKIEEGIRRLGEAVREEFGLGKFEH
ncbi:aromatic amino acid aminotransferase 1 [Dothidotthia symphoricarpi CBS 119687]|uniref:aromatic-amino-acid transaminase n=1 Tax=Dothidotthia symphoricarpi CBS 119687 TaxID=1392245 RepID=A0A6A6AP63_9PLEO|nr:aromatic amino acid aminotransferase 1 [Dothidotthia symphoricarpi CBS 119687]KAF2132724.1 aromatic amino acid aminotransferase 1 [Dothidotthia symphoricarpi CBS 119687]